MAPNRHFLRALFDGADTTLSEQPTRPTPEELNRRRHVLLGAPLPTSSAGNLLLDLYDSTGTIITINSFDQLRRVAGERVLGLALHDVVLPVSIELNVPWGLGAPGQVRDMQLTMAVYIQVSETPSTSVPLCAFSRACVPGSPDYDVNVANDRALRCMATVPLFKNPKLFMIPVKNEDMLPGGVVRRAWFPWQVCTNCMAARAKARCTHWYVALSVGEPDSVELVRPGDPQSLRDEAYGWWAAVRDNFMAKDKGFYNMWLCRNGELSKVADA